MTTSSALPAPVPDVPDVHGVARIGGPVCTVLPRLQPGDVAVVDHADLDRHGARRLLEAGVAAVVNVAPMISGRFPSIGPEMLTEAGIMVVDSAVGVERLRDAHSVTLSCGSVLVGGEEVARGRVVTLEQVRRDMLRARNGLLAQLDTFTHDAGEFLRREQDLVLNGVGLPEVTTVLEGRPVVVVSRSGDHAAALHSVQRFVREQNPVLIAVDKAVDDLLALGLAPHVAVVSVQEPGAMAGLDGLRSADDVVVRVERGAHPSMLDSLQRLGAHPLRCETAASAEDVALLLADAGQASVVVGVGVHAGLVELLDRERSGMAGTYLTRLKLGRTLVDASSVDQLYAGRVEPWHVAAVLLAGLVALLAAVVVTPAGQDWLDSLQGMFT